MPKGAAFSFNIMLSGQSDPEIPHRSSNDVCSSTLDSALSLETNDVQTGFFLAYRYGGRNDGKRIDETEFFIKRWAALYPLYFISVMIGKRNFVAVPGQGIEKRPGG